ncbi:heme-binding protein [Pseudanabaena mucicola]|uniref:Heme-binding protein n=1 Tax=Pseudanabaena mucicola FACHB-723 TaxID=2692860 RepID=A0ABR7ZWP3_9CYAN|nr:heme-binding protein [Pseudanabaena mucicola]MBD2188381.1 heme-binding protein [Pseudanabaena mucicola FACHB-723]
MKLSTVLLIFGAIAIPFALYAVNKVMSAPLPVGFPAPTAHNIIEVKQYPAYRSGTYTYEGNLSEATSYAFNPLFRHISSNNISMTSPVEARYPMTAIDQPVQSGKAKVSFLYNNNAINPQQIAQDIQVEDHAPMLAVSLGVQGAYGYDRFQSDVAKLKQWLAEHPEYEIAGEPREFLYDSPYTPSLLKRREVQIPIRAKV